MKIEPVVEYDQPSHSYTTSLVEKRVVQQMSLGEFAFSKDVTIKDLKIVQPKNNDEVNRMLLVLKLRSFLHFPFVSGEKKVGSVFDLPGSVLFEHQFPFYRVRVERVLRAGNHEMVELSPLFTDVKDFCDFYRKNYCEELAKQSFDDATKEQCKSALQKDLVRMESTFKTGGINMTACVSLDSGLGLLRKLHSTNNVQGLDNCTTTNIFCML